ncbi:glycosyltransferase family 4 protein [Clostridium perfringens]|nr:glycosyltransferase family 4 protein [Clostridium perfringens]ELU5588901.1 glycosyltransferase family 4 protein [Clostridium perfringens]MDU3844851.1 glycosyltransferase family 4 protein [Clostridium perfringens]
MKILFLTLVYSKNGNSIYKDLINELANQGNEIYVVTALERREKKNSYLEIESNKIKVLRIKTFNIQKTNLIEKGIGTLTIERKFIREIKKFYKNEKFDLVLYSTPPITFEKVISFVKKRDNCKSYLLLKDIFPQNAVDLGMFNKKSLFYKFFRRKEENLYKLSDYIGCMSPKNVEYLLGNNEGLEKEKVEVCPNSIKPSKNIYKDISIRNNFGINSDELLVIYGGNLGKPQGIGFLLEVLDSNKNNKNLKFMIIGSGTEKEKLFNFVKNKKLTNVIVKERLPKDQYDKLVLASDLGLIFLDKKFTIPNFPSRLLGYMDAGVPILAATDINTDIGEVIEKNNFGYWCESGDLNKFNSILNECISNKEELNKKGLLGKKYLEENYTAKHSANIILKHFT